jgi:hypothetical protein
MINVMKYVVKSKKLILMLVVLLGSVCFSGSAFATQIKTIEQAATFCSTLPGGTANISHGYCAFTAPNSTSPCVVGSVGSSPTFSATCQTRKLSEMVGYDDADLRASILSTGGESTQPSGSTGSECKPGVGSLTAQVFVPWYKYLGGEKVNGRCSPVFPKTAKGNYDVQKGLPLILIAVIELLLRISGLIAVGYGIYGAIRYIISQGQPDAIKGAKDTITNAIVGLIIVIISTAFVQFIGNAFK